MVNAFYTVHSQPSYCLTIHSLCYFNDRKTMPASNMISCSEWSYIIHSQPSYCLQFRSNHFGFKWLFVYYIFLIIDTRNNPNKYTNVGNLDDYRHWTRLVIVKDQSAHLVSKHTHKKQTSENLNSIGRRSCEIIMVEKHPCHTKLCAFICLILRPQNLILKSRNQTKIF